MLAHKNRAPQDLQGADREERRREMTEELMQVPEPGALFDAMAPRLPPQRIAEVAPQTQMSREAAERVLSLWTDEEDEDERPPPPEAYELRGPALDFAPDTDISAADYLAPDDIGHDDGPASRSRRGGTLHYSAGGGGGGGGGGGEDEGGGDDPGGEDGEGKGSGAPLAEGPTPGTQGDHG